MDATCGVTLQCFWAVFPESSFLDDKHGQAPYTN